MPQDASEIFGLRRRRGRSAWLSIDGRSACRLALSEKPTAIFQPNSTALLDIGHLLGGDRPATFEFGSNRIAQLGYRRCQYGTVSVAAKLDGSGGDGQG
jgi:hypothetical protein